MSIEKALSKSVTVQLTENESVEVKKLPLGKYAELMLALKNMPTDVIKDFQALDSGNEDQMIQMIFGAFGKAWGQVLDIIAIGSGVSKERIENDPDIGLDGGVALFVAIYEVNNLAKVFTQVKNVMNRPTK